MTDRLIYLDNAATTFPKPPEVLREMVETYARIGASPGRGNHDLAAQAGAFVDGARPGSPASSVPRTRPG